MHALARRFFMMRQSSSRNHNRSKGGFRLKHVLQICILLAICTWLIYQVKHSHDKKRAYEERFTKFSTNKLTEKETDFSNLGRKGLPLVNNKDSAAEIHVKDKDNEEGVVEEGDQEQEQVGDEEVKRDADDGADELDREGGDGENEQEEEFTSEDEKDGRADEEALFDNEEHEDNAQEAREQNYKRDDASSAVAHDGHEAKGLDGEQEIEDLGNDRNTTAFGDVASTTNVSTAVLGENATFANVDFTANVSDSKGPEVEFMKSENGSIMTPVSTEGSNQIELQPNTTMATLSGNNLEVTATPTANVSNSLPEHQNSMKLNETSDLTPVQGQQSLVNETSREFPVQGQQSLVNETSREFPVENDKKFNTSEGHELDIRPQNSTTIDS